MNPPIRVFVQPQIFPGVVSFGVFNVARQVYETVRGFGHSLEDAWANAQKSDDALIGINWDSRYA